MVVDRWGRARVGKHVTADLLCSDCENRISTNGENYVMRQVWNGKEFPLLNRLNVALEVRKLDDVLVYSGSAAGIDTEKLAYFALSVLWRASIREWRTSKLATFRLPLGQDEEPLRQYLKGETEFPANVSVIVTVCTDIYSRVFHLPTVATFPIPITAYSFVALGVNFLVIMGPFAPEKVCCVRSREKVISKRNCGRKMLEAYAYLLAQT
jgi:hypothetical protein